LACHDFIICCNLLIVDLFPADKTPDYVVKGIKATQAALTKAVEFVEDIKEKLKGKCGNDIN